MFIIVLKKLQISLFVGSTFFLFTLPAFGESFTVGEPIEVFYPTKSDNPALVQKVLQASKSNDIVFIGASHQDKNDLFALDLMAAVQKSDSPFNCLFWEESLVFENVMAKARTNFEYYKKNFYKTQLPMGKLFTKYIGKWPNTRRIWPNYFERYQKLEVLSIPVDHSSNDANWLKRTNELFRMEESNDEYWRLFVELLLEERNNRMSEKIFESFQAQKANPAKCDKAFMVIGTEHILEDPYKKISGISNRSLSKLLELKGLKTAKVFLNLTYDDAPLPHPKVSEINTAENLANNLRTGLQLPYKNNPFKNFDYLQAIEIQSQDKPLGRDGRLRKDDFGLQRGIQVLVDRGLIKPGTLVISDTGHDLPMAAQISKNEGFDVQSVFFFPEELADDEINLERVTSQAQDWAEDIALEHSELMESGKRPNIIFLGLEGHRKKKHGGFLYKFDHQKIDSNALLEMEIKQVVYLYERHPDTDAEEIKDLMLKDVQPFLEKLDLPVFFYGTDCRRGDKC